MIRAVASQWQHLMHSFSLSLSSPLMLSLCSLHSASSLPLDCEANCCLTEIIVLWHALKRSFNPSLYFWQGKCTSGEKESAARQEGEGGDQERDRHPLSQHLSPDLIHPAPHCQSHREQGGSYRSCLIALINQRETKQQDQKCETNLPICHESGNWK